MIDWRSLSRGELLQLRLKDLDLDWRDSRLARPIQKVTEELSRRGLVFQPHFWLSTEWFCPDGVPGVALPFYLAHPRLLALEREQMHEAEGATEGQCLKILRHEIGHAIQNAYALRKKSELQSVFGPFDRSYPARYTPLPHSRGFVRHLRYGYAQSHPDEDFAETFAVWLAPDSNWEKRYQDWPALEKLKCVERCLGTLRGVVPQLKNTRRVEAIETLETKLETFYRRKRRHYGLAGNAWLDHRLQRAFPARKKPRSMTADRFLRTIRNDLARRLALESGRTRFDVDRAVHRWILRTKELGLGVGTRVSRNQLMDQVLPLLSKEPSSLAL